MQQKITIDWENKLQGYEFFPSCYEKQLKRFSELPTLLVIHSGAVSAHVAQYLSSCDTSDKRKVAVHFAWHSKICDFVQMVGLQKRAWHVGGSVYNGRQDVNLFSIGIEMAGPWRRIRDEEEHGKLIKLISSIRETVPSILWITRHMDIDKSKRDPGNGLDFEYIKTMTGFYDE